MKAAFWLAVAAVLLMGAAVPAHAQYFTNAATNYGTLTTTAPGNAIGSGLISPQGDRVLLYVPGTGFSVIKRDNTGSTALLAYTGAAPAATCWSPDGQFVILSGLNTAAPTYRVLNSWTGAPGPDVSAWGIPPATFAELDGFSADGEFLYYLKNDTSPLGTYLRDAGTGQEVRVYGTSGAQGYRPQFTPDGNYVFYINADGYKQVYRLKTRPWGQSPQTADFIYWGPQASTTCYSVSGDGDIINAYLPDSSYNWGIKAYKFSTATHSTRYSGADAVYEGAADNLQLADDSTAFGFRWDGTFNHLSEFYAADSGYYQYTAFGTSGYRIYMTLAPESDYAMLMRWPSSSGSIRQLFYIKTAATYTAPAAPAAPTIATVGADYVDLTLAGESYRWYRVYVNGAIQTAIQTTAGTTRISNLTGGPWDIAYAGIDHGWQGSTGSTSHAEPPAPPTPPAPTFTPSATVDMRIPGASGAGINSVLMRAKPRIKR